MEKKKEFIINIVCIVIICGLVYVGINYLLPLLNPFIFGFIFAYFAIKIARKVFKREDKLIRILSLMLLYILIIVVIALLIVLGIDRIGEFIKTFPDIYRNAVEPAITSIETFLNNQFTSNVGNEISDKVINVFDSLRTVLSSLATNLVSLTTSILSGTPEVVISIIVMIISSFYIVIDYEGIARWLTVELLSQKALNVFYEVKDFVEGTLAKILLSYLKIMGITFVELLIGLTILRVKNSSVVALIIAVLDIFPVLGVGTVLIPWGLITIASNQLFLGIGLLVLYAIISIIRNIIEPRIVGDNLELHPLATLICMIVGLRLFGAVGMFGCPIVLSFFVTRKARQASN